jgi:hypothetical protein
MKVPERRPQVEEEDDEEVRYLKASGVMKVLSKGLKETCQSNSAKPITFFANWLQQQVLIKNNSTQHSKDVNTIWSANSSEARTPVRMKE